MARPRGRPVGATSAPDRRKTGKRVPVSASLERLPFPDWCEKYLVQSVDRWAGTPLVLEPFQRDVMDEALARDGDSYRWKTIVLVLPRKNGKTSLLAAYALYRLLTDEGQPEILLAAASDKQAGRLFDAVCSFVYQNPDLQEHVHLRAYQEISRKDGGGKILRMASDPATLHGYNPSLVVCDELHAWTKPSQRKGWAALTTGGGGRQLTQVVAISTAGPAEERHEGILGVLIDGNEAAGELEHRPGLTVSRNHDARVLVFNYAAPTSDHVDIDALLFANPASWIDAAYLRQQAETPSLSCALASTTGVVARGLTHDGNPRLAAHLANAVVLERPEGAVITKVDRLDVADRNPHLAVLGPHVRAQNVALRAPETITTTIRPATASRYHTNTE